MGNVMVFYRKYMEIYGKTRKYPSGSETLGFPGNPQQTKGGEFSILGLITGGYLLNLVGGAQPNGTCYTPVNRSALVGVAD